MKKLHTLVLGVVLVLATSLNGFSQKLEVIKSSHVEIKQLPEYVIVTSQNTKLLGGIGITIDAKKSRYKKELNQLNDLLQDSDKLKIRNQTDLLNAMSELGYDFLDAYNASQVVNSRGNKDAVDDVLNIVEGGKGTYRVNMIFRKKVRFRK